jgi:hypothetical protein
MVMVPKMGIIFENLISNQINCIAHEKARFGRLNKKLDILSIQTHILNSKNA